LKNKAIPCQFFRLKARYNQCATRFRVSIQEDTAVARFFHPLLTLIASSTDRDLAKYLLDSKKFESRAALARFLGVSRARVTQIVNRLKTTEDSCTSDVKAR
jgi:hypothetical protein